MGMTWHTKCMFDLDCAEPSFSDILLEHGIETYTFDNSKIGHRHNVDLAVQLIQQYQIDHIMAYSYGCRVVLDLLDRVNVKGIMLLDPSSTVQVKKEKTPTGFTVYKADIDSILTANSVQTTAQMRAAHIAAVSDSDQLSVPGYIDHVINTTPPLHQKNLSRVFAGAGRLFLTGQCQPRDRQWRPEITTLYPNNSHWILLEPGRYQLAEDVSNFVTHL